ncbi:hypothetical protein JCM11491_002279 [Sporobolomyces phaffii]
MTRYFCHECQHEGSDFLVTPSPLCPRCQGSFVEELPEDDSVPTEDDPRDFDPDDGGFPLGALLQGFGAAGGGQLGGGGGLGGGRATGGAFTFAIGPGGNIVVGSGEGGGPNAGAPPGPDLGQTLFRAFGLAPPLGGNGGAGGRMHERGADDPEDEELPQDERGRNPNQVPIQNLAAFLGEAFGDPEPHPADDPSNNPFAEGGVDPPPANPHDRRAQSDPGVAGGNALGGEQAGGRGNPLNYLFSLMNSFGINGQMLNSGLSGNAGDYVWGGEANFQNLLNDLMEQAAGRAGPVPATEEMIEKLPKVEVTPDLLSHDTVKDCTICQDDFAVSETLASLPCRHLFHPDCIVPWLKTSGTCPVCRYAMIPQPGQEGYVEPPRPGNNVVDPAQQDGSRPATDATGEGGGAHQASTAASSSAGFQPQRPSAAWSRQSSAASIPSTARIPEVDNGSRLPGSWTFGGSAGEGLGDRMDVDEEEDAWTDADNDEEDKSPEARAAEAAERRLQAERQGARGEREPSLPVIEDVD